MKMKLAVTSLILVFAVHLDGAVGCMDTSHYLNQDNDHKELHYVNCDCACDQATLLRTHGTCLQCQHVHMPREWIIMRNGKQIATTLQYRSVSEQDTKSMSEGMQQLIKSMVLQYKKDKKGKLSS